jgi:CBS domain containing-hemolysin-like protein
LGHKASAESVALMELKAFAAKTELMASMGETAQQASTVRMALMVAMASASPMRFCGKMAISR